MTIKHIAAIAVIAAGLGHVAPAMAAIDQEAFCSTLLKGVSLVPSEFIAIRTTASDKFEGWETSLTLADQRCWIEKNVDRNILACRMIDTSFDQLRDLVQGCVPQYALKDFSDESGPYVQYSNGSAAVQIMLTKSSVAPLVIFTAPF